MHNKCYHYHFAGREQASWMKNTKWIFDRCHGGIFQFYMIACFKYRKWDEMNYIWKKTLHYPILSLQRNPKNTHNYCYCGILFVLAWNKLKKAHGVNTFRSRRIKYTGKYRMDFLLFTLCQCGCTILWTKITIQEQVDLAKLPRGPRYSVELRAQAVTVPINSILFYTVESELLSSSWSIPVIF